MHFPVEWKKHPRFLDIMCKSFRKGGVRKHAERRGERRMETGLGNVGREEGRKEREGKGERGVETG